MDEKPKQTQGQKKTRLRLKELFDNEIFKKELSNILANPNKKKQNKQLWKFAEKYSLEFEMGSPFLDLVTGRNSKILDEQIGHELDVCELYDEVDEYLNENFPRDFDIPPSRRPDKRAQLNAFPIHIGISPQATKRDVLDFISKRWDHIRYMLDTYLEKPKIIRVKPKSKRDEFIWKNRNLPSSKIAELVNEKYPDSVLTYSDINSILYYLRKRKQTKLV